MKPPPNHTVIVIQSATMACRIRLGLPTSSLNPNRLLFPCQAMDDILSLCGGLSSDVEPPSTAGGSSLAKGSVIFGIVVGIVMASFRTVILRSTTASARYLVRFTTVSNRSNSLNSYLAEMEMLCCNRRICDSQSQMPLRYCHGVSTYWILYACLSGLGSYIAGPHYFYVVSQRSTHKPDTETD